MMTTVGIMIFENIVCNVIYFRVCECITLMTFTVVIYYVIYIFLVLVKRKVLSRFEWNYEGFGA